MTRQEIERRFQFHAVTGEQKERMAKIRAAMIEAAVTVSLHVSDGREQSLALTKLEEASMHAMSGIAREQA